MKRIHEDRPLTNAEKQKRFRERQKAAKRKRVFVPEFYADAPGGAGFAPKTVDELCLGIRAMLAGARATTRSAEKGAEGRLEELVCGEIAAWAAAVALPRCVGRVKNGKRPEKQRRARSRCLEKQ